MSDLLAVVDPPNHWHVRRFDRLVDRVKEIDRADLQPLSVFLGEGVVPRSTRDDNYNRLGEDLSKYLVVKPGDIVFNKLRTWQGGLGVSKYEGIVSPAYYVCRPRQDVEPRFLHYLLRSTTYLQELTRISKWMPPSQFDISWEDLRLLPTLLPTKDVQQAIADFLDAETARIDALIDKKRSLTNALEERFQRVVSGAIWKGSSHRRVALKRLVGLPTSGNRDHGSFVDSEHGVPCLRGLNIRAGKIDRANLLRISKWRHTQLSATQLRAGDLVIVRSGLAGAAAVIPPDLDGSNCVDLVILRRTDTVDPYWLEYVINSDIAQTQVVKNHAGALLQHFNAVDAGELRIPSIPIQKQREVSAWLHERRRDHERLADALARQMELLIEHRQALITAAVTGQIEVPGAVAS